jgi:hypothetical protein
MLDQYEPSDFGGTDPTDWSFKKVDRQLTSKNQVNQVYFIGQS